MGDLGRGLAMQRTHAHARRGDAMRPLRLAKLSAPRTSDWLARARLHSVLDDVTRAGVVWLVGGPGTGKTTLAACWAAERGPAHAVVPRGRRRRRSGVGVRLSGPARARPAPGRVPSRLSIARAGTPGALCAQFVSGLFRDDRR